MGLITGLPDRQPLKFFFPGSHPPCPDWAAAGFCGGLDTEPIKLTYVRPLSATKIVMIFGAITFIMAALTLSPPQWRSYEL